jgi:hypothetical protein
LTHNLNLCLLFSVCLLTPAIQSSKNEAKLWIDYSNFCQNPTCRHFLQAHKGIFCANYLSKRGGFASCEGAWCPGCYVPLGILNFPIRQKVDDDGDELIEEEDATWFLCARTGDHLMTPFQCEKCHVRNMMG